MNAIYLKSSEEISLLKEAQEATAGIMKDLKSFIKPGISTKAVDDFARELISDYGVVSAFLGYRGYPAAVCVSIDSEVVHGIPSPKRFIAEGQIVSLDIGVVKNGFYGDMAVTLPIGGITPEKKKLLLSARRALESAIKNCREGMRLGDVSYSIQKEAESSGFNVVRDFVGHGIGRNMHEEPQVPNYGSAGSGVRLKAGMVFALEPMVNLGTYEVDIKGDGWTVVTRDNSPSAHFETVVAVGKEGPMVLVSLDKVC